VSRRIALLSASEADRAFRVRRGTCRGLWCAGAIRGAERPGRGRTGRALYLRRDDLETYFAARSPHAADAATEAAWMAARGKA